MFPSGERAAAKEFWSKLSLGGYIAVWYDDDTVWHHRLLLASARVGRYAMLTSDGDVYVESVLAEGVRTVPRAAMLVNKIGRPRGQVHRIPPCPSFAHASW